MTTQQTAIGSIPEEDIANENGVNLLLNGAYSALDGVRLNQLGNGFAISPDNWWLDVMSDDAHKGSTDGDQLELYQLETYNIQTSNPYVLGKWMSLYAGVNRANAVMALIATIEGGGLFFSISRSAFHKRVFKFRVAENVW